MSKITPFLMFNDQLGPALDFYKATFPGTEVHSVKHAGPGGPVLSAEFSLSGQRFMAYNGGSHFSFSEGFSLFVACEDQTEVDLYWDKIVAAGGKPTACGWIRDPFGLSLQIIPKRFMELMGDPNPKKSQAVVAAMLKMVKLDVAALERAHAAA